MMRRFALPFLALVMIAVTPSAMAEPPTADTIRSVLPLALAQEQAGKPAVPCELDVADAALLQLDWRGQRGGVQLACSQGCLRRCAAVYRRCQARSRDWRRCSAMRRNCIRSCGC